MTSPRYAEIQVTSHFSFLRGASSCEELFAQAALLGIEALAIVDRNSLAGVVRPTRRPRPPASASSLAAVSTLLMAPQCWSTQPIDLLMRGSADCCRSASDAAARPSAISNGAILQHMGRA
jgi:hypothetical protein